MMLTFKDLDINVADYNGVRWSMARALIIDKACNAIMNMFVKNDTIPESDVIPFPELAYVDVTMQRLIIIVDKRYFKTQ